MAVKTQIIICLVILGAVDMIIPIPITAIWLIYVVFQKPVWFKKWVDEIYET